MRPALRHALTAVAIALLSIAVSATPASASPDPGPTDLRIVTVPAVAGAVFSFDGVQYTTDSLGQITIGRVGSLADLEARLSYVRYDGDPTTDATFTEFWGLGGAYNTREAAAEFLTSDAVSMSFVDLAGNEVPRDRVTSMVIKNSLGVEYTYTGAELESPQMLPSVRAVPSPTGPESKEIYYTVQEVVIDGTNTVNRSQQKFFPAQVDEVAVETQFFHVTVTVSDAFFGFSSGDAVLLRWPDGRETKIPLENGQVELPPLPRGEYEMRVDGPGLVTWRPVSVSRDQEVHLELMSVYDIGAVLLVVVAIAVSLVIVGRRRHRAGRARQRVNAGPDAQGHPPTQAAHNASEAEVPAP